MKISFEVKDILNYFDLEMYIKERDYLVNQREYLLLKRKARELNAKELKFEIGKKDYKDNIEIDGIAVFIFAKEKDEEFHCWTNVLPPSKDVERKRKLTIAKEEVNSIALLRKYIEERNYLLMNLEDAFVQKKARELKVKRIKLELDLDCLDILKNQSAGKINYYFENDYLFTHLMPYDGRRLERKK